MPPAKKQKVELQFPIEGQVEGTGHANQKPNTTSDCKNVRPFDVEEDRARGGRRDGVSKVTSTPVTGEKIDHMEFVQRANESTVYEPGQLMEFPEGNPNAGKLANFTFPSIPVGQQITQSGANFLYFGRALQFLNGPTDNVDSSYPASSSSDLANVGPFHGAIAYNEQRSAKPINMFDYSNLVKYKDADNAEYVDINSKNFGYAGAPYQYGDGGVYETSSQHRWRPWSEFVDGRIDSHILINPLNRNWVVSSGFFVSPNTGGFLDSNNGGNDDKDDYIFAPWSSTKRTSYVTSLDFRCPYGMPADIEYNGGDPTVAVKFVATADDVDGNNCVYDPYYNELMGSSTSTMPHTWLVNSPNQEGHDDYSHYITWGIALRCRISSDGTDSEANYTHGYMEWHDYYGSFNDGCNAQDNAKTPIVIRFKMEIRTGKVDMFIGGWADHRHSSVEGTVFAMQQANAHLGYSYLNQNGNQEGKLGTVIASREDDLDENGDRKRHKLVVTQQDKSLSVSFDGNVLWSAEDIEDTEKYDWHTYPHIRLGGVYSHGHPVSHHRSKLIYGHTLQVSPSSSSTQNEYVQKQALKYFGTFDHVNQPDSSGDTAESANANNSLHGSRHKWSLGLKVYDWDWRSIDPVIVGRRHVTAVSGGKVHSTTPDDLSNFTIRSTSQDLSTNVNRIDGTSFFENIYFVDGSNYKYFDSSQMKVLDWNTLDENGEINTNSTLPGGNGDTGLYGSGTSDENPRCTIIKSWLGRLVMAGKSDEPQNWFMSAVGDATDFDPDSSAPGASVWGSKSENIGEISDPIIAIAPSIDNRLIISTSNYIYAMTGDPLWDGTQLVSISTEVGFIGPDAWCYGPNRVLYFMGPNGLYALAPNEFNITQTNRLSSGKLDKTFKDLDLSSSACKLVYDNVNHGVHIFLTPANQSTDKRSHYFYDSRTNSFWPMEYPGVIGPTYVMDFQSPNPEANKILLGGFDGHIRSFSSSAQDDDGTIIDSHVWIGPISLSSTQEVKLTEMLAILDEQTPGLSYEVYAADTVEQAKSGTPIFSGRWNGGRNNYVRTRARGAAIFIKLLDGTKQDPWAMERLAATLAVAGRARIR